MTVNDILSISDIINNNTGFTKNNLTMVYEIDETDHIKLDKELFDISEENKNKGYVYNDVIEVKLGGVIFVFIPIGKMSSILKY